MSYEVLSETLFAFKNACEAILKWPPRNPRV